MLARINKHIPKASELQMVTLFLITNIFSCPPLRYHAQSWRWISKLWPPAPSKSVQFLYRNRSLLVGLSSTDLRQMNIGRDLVCSVISLSTYTGLQNLKSNLSDRRPGQLWDVTDLDCFLNWIYASLVNFKSDREGWKISDRPIW